MKVGFTCGCFDGLHAGHKHLLREAARLCDYLVVAVNSDEWCREWKGPERPIIRLEDRIEAIGLYLHFVPGAARWNHAIIPFAGRDWELISAIRPDVVFRGYDQKPTALAFPVIVVDKLPGFSTTSQARSAS
jgi:cytidyltransferase-like protein